MYDFLDEKGKEMLKAYLMAKRKTYTELMGKAREKERNTTLESSNYNKKNNTYNKRKTR